MELTKGTKSKQWSITIVESNTEEEGMSDEALLLRYYRQFRHISFSRLQDMANIGVISKRLNKCRIPMSSACMYANATKILRRGKKILAYTPKVITKPGEVLSVDQLV